MTGALTFPDFTPGHVWLAGAGPGDPGLLTLHALHALEQADVVLHDALVSPAILALARGRLESVGKRGRGPSTPQLKINARLVALAQRGLKVLRLKGGDPFIFGRGGEEALALAAAGVPFRIIPGVSAGLAAGAGAAIPLTHRHVSRSVAFVTGHAPGEVDWAALAQGADTLVVYMARANLGVIGAALVAAGRPAAQPAALVADAGTPQELLVETTLDRIEKAAAALAPGAAVVAIIGEVVSVRALLASHAPAAATLSAQARAA